MEYLLLSKKYLKPTYDFFIDTCFGFIITWKPKQLVSSKTTHYEMKIIHKEHHLIGIGITLFCFVFTVIFTQEIVEYHNFTK